MLDAYIYDGLRCPFSRLGGCLSRKRPDDLMADVLTALLAQCDVSKDRIEICVPPILHEMHQHNQTFVELNDRQLEVVTYE